mmetsp:Transcript_34782/g.109824  ORF Transcript_34782/g.109824 Transcript_34782/m.109824 type:complete len:219 (-) Transcript_34782:318-974(-)
MVGARVHGHLAVEVERVGGTKELLHGDARPLPTPHHHAPKGAPPELLHVGSIHAREVACCHERRGRVGREPLGVGQRAEPLHIFVLPLELFHPQAKQGLIIIGLYLGIQKLALPRSNALHNGFLVEATALFQGELQLHIEQQQGALALGEDQREFLGVALPVDYAGEEAHDLVQLIKVIGGKLRHEVPGGFDNICHEIEHFRCLGGRHLVPHLQRAQR